MTTDDAERTRTVAAPVRDDDDVPRLPRGRGLRLSGPQLVRIVGTVGLLVLLVVMQRPCADSVSKFVTGFGGSGGRGSAAAQMPRPGTIDVPVAQPGRAGPAVLGSAAGSAGTGGGDGPGLEGPGLDGYERLRPGMTDAEVKAAIERARVRAAGSGAAR